MWNDFYVLTWQNERNFNFYMDINLHLFDHQPNSTWIFFTLIFDKNRLFSETYPPCIGVIVMTQVYISFNVSMTMSTFFFNQIFNMGKYTLIIIPFIQQFIKKITYFSTHYRMFPTCTVSTSTNSTSMNFSAIGRIPY